VGIAVNSVGLAGSIFPLAIVPFITFSGSLLNADDVPVYLVWLQYISYIRYGFEILFVNEFEGLEFECDSDEFIREGNITICPIRTGEQAIDNYEFETGIFGRNFAVMIAIWCFLFLFGLGLLKLRMRQKRE